MNPENSKINLVVYQGKNLPLYYVLGAIENGRIEASVRDYNKEIAQVTGLLRPTGCFFFRAEFYYAKHSFLDISGWFGKKSPISRVEIDNVEHEFFFEGIIGERISSKFSLISLEEGVNSFVVSGEIM